MKTSATTRALWKNQDEWTRKSILNTARAGKFFLRPLHPRLLRTHLEHFSLLIRTELSLVR